VHTLDERDNGSSHPVVGLRDERGDRYARRRGGSFSSAIYLKQRSDYQHGERSKDSVLALSYVNAGPLESAPREAPWSRAISISRGPIESRPIHARALVALRTSGAEGGGLSIQGEFLS